MLFPETKTERKNRLIPFLHLHTCPTTDGKDLETWEELKAMVWEPKYDLFVSHY